MSSQTTAAHPHYNVWVGANAGTGKTKVLTDRVLRLLLQGEHPSSIICLTFTKAAASEMQHRINGHVSRWASMEEEALVHTLTELTGEVPDAVTLQRARRLFLQLLDLPGGLSIQTIHAFCQHILSRFPLEAGIAPHTELLDDFAAYDLLRQAKNRLLEDDNQAVKEAVAHLSGRMAEGQFGALLGYMMSSRDKLIEHDIPDMEALPDEEVLVCQLCEEAPFAWLRLLIEGLETGTKTDIGRAEQLTLWINQSAEERIQHYQQYVLCFLTQKNEPRQKIATKKAVASIARPALAEEITQEQMRLVGMLDALCQVRVARDTAAFLTIAHALLSHYDTLKAEAQAIDYHDLIAVTRNLLSREDIAPWVLYKLDYGISHVLVDEAQDTSPEQWALITLLTEEFFTENNTREYPRTLFVVGDEKQSIYSFQGADPKVFHQMHTQCAQHVKASGNHWQSIALDRSFRSTQAVLGLVDHVFSDPSLRAAVSASGTPVSHAVFRSGHGGEVELWPLVSVPEKEARMPWELPIVQKPGRDGNAQLARHIAARVRFWLDNETVLPSKNRPIQPGDIMILLKKRGNLMEKLVSGLKAEGVPVAGVDRLRLNEHIAVMDLLALAHFLLLPEDDLNLATLLKSPLFGLTDDDLFILCHGRDASLWSVLSRHSDYQEQASMLTALLQETDYLSPFALFSDVLYCRGGLQKMRARLGEEIIEPVEEFLSLALTYEASHTASLQEFVGWMQRQTIEIKRDMESGHNAVRVMTVHGSKGLQAPIVILPDGVDVPKARTPESVTTEKGELLFCANSDDRTLAYNAAYEAKRQQELDEYYRLLYVALTRAEDSVYITGAEPAQKISDKSWYAVLTRAMQAIGRAFTYDEDAGTIGYHYACEQEVEIAAKELTAQDVAPAVLPEYFRLPAQKEARRLVPLSPSLLEDEGVCARSPLGQTGRYFLRGKLIHRLLQYLPEIPEQEREHAALQFLERYKDSLDVGAIWQSIAHIFAAYPGLFGKDSRAEVPIIGHIGKQQISGQIDRLVVENDRVLVIDYKTQTTPPVSLEAIPQPYRRQMELYRGLLQKIYPDREVVCLLLWTENGEVMEVSAEGKRLFA